MAEATVCPELFRLVAAEEHRHCEEAHALARPDGSCQELVSSLEVLLYEVVRWPGIVVPLSFLIGPVACARMAIANVTKHLDACRSLGVQPSQQIRDLMTTARAALLVGDREPSPLEMHGWEISRQRLWSQPAPMMAFEKMPAPREASLADLESMTVHRASVALAAHPQLNRVAARGRLFRPLDIRVGVRRSWDLEGELITTVYVDNGHMKSISQIKTEIHRKAERYRRRPYEPVPDVSAVRHLLPPARCPIVISQVGGFGIRGVGPLSQDEGAPISIFIGRQETIPEWCETDHSWHPRPVAHLWVVYDHRAGNGRELGLLVKILTEES
jgi:hypothetical protein